MIKYKELNNISKELLETVPKLGPKDSAEYRLLNMRKDPENPGHWMIPSSTGIKVRAQIVDPFTNEIAEIANITQMKSRPTEGGSIDYPDIKPVAFLRSQGGRIILHGSRPQDVLLHQYLYLCPLNAGSPVKGDETPVYEYIDVKANAKRGMSRMQKKIKAMGMIDKLTPSDGLFDYAYMVSRAETDDVEVARYQLAEFAEADADKFFELIESIDGQIKVTYLRAMSQGIIAYDAQSGTVRWAKNQEVITAIPKVVKQREEAFAVWAKASAANMKLVDTLSAMVSKRTPVTPPAPVEEVEEEEAVVNETEPKPKRGRPKKD